MGCGGGDGGGEEGGEVEDVGDAVDVSGHEEGFLPAVEYVVFAAAAVFFGKGYGLGVEFGDVMAEALGVGC